MGNAVEIGVAAEIARVVRGIGQRGVDRLLDMFRTTVNVWSDSCGTSIIASSEGETDLKILAGSRA